MDCWISWVLHWIYQWIYWLLSILAQFLPTFLGVLLAFALTRWWEKRSEREQKDKLKRAFKSELDICMDKLRPMNGQYVPTIVWEGAVGSGVLRLLSPEEVIRLSNVYAGFRNYNYEATNSRRLAERQRITPNIHDKQSIKEELKRVVVIRNHMAKSCMGAIEQLIADWFR